jgi:prolipoprotein diacylglyceryltransferase
VVIGVPLGQAIGRLGNLVNGELYGKNGEPLFAWEAMLSLILFGILWKMSTSEVDISGKISGVYLVGYGLIRILLENFRPNEIIWKWHGVPVAIIFGVLAVFAGGVILKKKQS